MSPATEQLQVRTEPLGGGTLARAALEGRAPASWFQPAPRGGDGWRARAESVRASTARDAIARLLPAISPSGAAADRLRRAAEQGIVVTTGQQPGLFGGPVYTWTKALSALALADEIERLTGLPTAPLFWAATDDADFAEAASTVVAAQGGAETIAISRTAPDGTPMSSVPLPDMQDALARLARAAGSAAYAPALEVARSAYHPGATVGGAYVGLLRSLLEPLGVPVLDASHPAVTEAAEPLLRLALERAEALEAALAEREREITAAGLTPQVPLVRGLTLVQRLEDGRRARVPAREAAPVLAVTDAALGATVLLRPVVERAILPTVAYVAGPGELAYFAQASAVAAVLGAQQPLALPRWSATVIEPHVARILARYGLDADELRMPDAAETRLARAALPAGVRGALSELDADVARGLASLAGAAAGIGVPPTVHEGARRQIAQRLARLERRHVSAVRRNDETMRRDVGTARGALYPGGVRQERALNFIPLLARHGPPLLARMREQAAAHARALVGG